MSSFTTELIVRVLDEERRGRSLAMVTEGFCYDVGEKDSGERITVPRGFVTDFGSIPRFFWRLAPPWGRYAKATVIHDLLYATRGTGMIDGVRWISRRTDYSREECDDIFYEAMGVLKVPGWKRAMMFAAVRVGGGGGFGS